MAQNPEHLKKLLKFIDDICRDGGNEWFKEELAKKIGTNQSAPTNLLAKDELSFDSFVRLQRKIFKTKALEFYKTIDNNGLKNELVKDYVEMSWYKTINNVERYFLFLCYQAENMLNFFILQNDSFTKIQKDPRKYSFAFTEKFKVNCHSYFFSKEGQPLEIVKISSLWSKVAFWLIETNSHEWGLKNKKSLDYVINIRNLVSHRNSQENNEIVLSQISNFKNGDDINLSYPINVLKKLRGSL